MLFEEKLIIFPTQFREKSIEYLGKAKLISLPLFLFVDYLIIMNIDESNVSRR